MKARIPVCSVLAILISCMLLAARSTAAIAGSQSDAVALTQSAVVKGNCLLRDEGMQIPILKALDNSKWQTCMGVTLEPWLDHKTKCAVNSAVKVGDKIHIRTGADGAKELTYVSDGTTVLNRVKVEQGPNPFRPLWLRTQRDGFAYYVYMLERNSVEGVLLKHYMLEVFDLSDHACLDELPENPGIVGACKLVNSLGLARRDQTGVGSGPENRPVANHQCEQLP